jgi:polysaccharide export outer membrane protein
MVAPVAAAFALLAGCAGPAAKLPDLAAAPPAAYRLGPGDEVRVSVFGLDAMTNSYKVGDTGMIALPLLDPVPVAGRTVRETDLLVADAIRARKLVLDPRVSTQIQAYRPFYIMGEVQKPGQYPYIPGMSLLTAVSVAGGFTFRADRKTAVIARASARGRARPDTPILPDDSIIIGESWF